MGGITPAGPLSNLLVLELGSLIAGPFCTHLMADLGARVIKIEQPDRGDPLRTWSHLTVRGSLWFMVQARNKESITVDLGSGAGQGIVRRLVDKADILVENFQPGKMEGWGLGPDEMTSSNPGLVYVRISGYGQTGPYRDRPGFGNIAESIGGLRHITGSPDRPPVRVGISLGDSLAAMFATIGALSALNRRQETGRGDVIDIGLHEAVFALLEGILPEYGVAGLVRQRAGNVLPGSAPTSTYPTRDGKYISIGANSDTIFPRLCRLMGQPELATDRRFTDNQSRRGNVTKLDSLIQEWTLTRDLEDLWSALNEAQVPAGPVYAIDEIARDPQFLARDMILPVDVDGVGEVLMPGIVPKLAEAPGSIRWPGPSLGAHTDLVLERDLGCTPQEIDDLRSSGVVGGGPAAVAPEASQPT